jgi:hypothetical protein
MGLDIKTEKGKKTVVEEIKMLKYISKCWNVKIKITNKDSPVPFDGFIIVDDKIVGIFESKNRQISLHELELWGSWLVTHEKITTCSQLSIFYGVPFYGFLGIEKDQAVMCWKITNEKGEFLFEYDHHHQLTQDNVNGGEANRDNAFLPYKFGKFVQLNQKIF